MSAAERAERARRDLLDSFAQRATGMTVGDEGRWTLHAVEVDYLLDLLDPLLDDYDSAMRAVAADERAAAAQDRRWQLHGSIRLGRVGAAVAGALSRVVLAVRKRS